jgi:nuclear pore complex protein Nup93
VNDAPVWALIYILLRTGHLIDAVQFLQTASILSSFQTLEPSFPAYLKAYATSPNRTLPRHLLDRLHVEFNQRIRYYKADEDDPFKFALYKLLGRCDVQKRAMPSKVVATSEDYLWVQLVLARENEVSGDKWGLGDVAKSVVKAGRTAWDRSGQRPEGYFLVLILVGEYERVTSPLTRLTGGCTLSFESFSWRRNTFCNCFGMVRVTAYFDFGDSI